MCFYLCRSMSATIISAIRPPPDAPAVAAITTGSVTGGSVEGVIAGN